jgi:hypothetical protein
MCSSQYWHLSWSRNKRLQIPVVGAGIYEKLAFQPSAVLHAGHDQIREHLAMRLWVAMNLPVILPGYVLSSFGMTQRKLVVSSKQVLSSRIAHFSAERQAACGGVLRGVDQADNKIFKKHSKRAQHARAPPRYFRNRCLPFNA